MARRKTDWIETSDVNKVIGVFSVELIVSEATGSTEDPQAIIVSIDDCFASGLCHDIFALVPLQLSLPTTKQK